MSLVSGVCVCGGGGGGVVGWGGWGWCWGWGGGGGGGGGGEGCSTMATISVRPPGEQMGYVPANEMRRKSVVFAPVRVSHAYAHTHASGRRECVLHTRTVLQS